MRKVIASAAFALFGTVSTGCGDTCTQLCGEAADFHETCLDSWGHTWSDLGYADAADFVDQCQAGYEASVSCVGQWCADNNTEDPDAASECTKNETLGIQRSCETNKDLYRQPCQDYWQSVVQLGTPVFDSDPATCKETTEEEAT